MSYYHIVPFPKPSIKPYLILNLKHSDLNIVNIYMQRTSNVTNITAVILLVRLF